MLFILRSALYLSPKPILLITMSKEAVFLLNLGSPASTSVADVRAYLKEFLLDERVIDAPAPVRNLVVRGLILPRRPRESAHAYSKVWTPEGSPLVVTSERQQALLAEATGLPVYLAMRYGEPSIASVVADIARAGVQKLLIMPLYPQYAMSSYETVVVRVMEELQRQAPTMDTELLQPFYKDADYIGALVERSRPWLEKDFDQLLFSFHGIPQRHLRKSDPSHAHCLSTDDCCSRCHPAHATCYKHQCMATVQAFVEKAGLPADKYRVTFQSRLGRDPWITPYTDHALEAMPGEGIKKLLVICPAFIADCLETLEEISMAGRESFLDSGGEFFEQIPCLNDSPECIRWLTGRVNTWRGPAAITASQ